MALVALVMIGIVSALNLAKEQRRALDMENFESASRKRSQSRYRVPTAILFCRAAVFLGARPGDESNGTRKLGNTLDLQAIQVWGRFVDRLLNRQFECHAGGRAAMTASLKSQVSNAIFNTKQLDVTAMRLEIRPHLIQRSQDACLHVYRMQPVNQKQGAHQFIVVKGSGQGVVWSFCLPCQFENAGQPLAVHIQQRLEQFLGRGAGMRVWKRSNLLD